MDLWQVAITKRDQWFWSGDWFQAELQPQLGLRIANPRCQWNSDGSTAISPLRSLGNIRTVGSCGVSACTLELSLALVPLGPLGPTWAPGLGWGTTFLTLGCHQDLGSGTGVGDYFPDLRVSSGFGLRDWGWGTTFQTSGCR